MIVIGITGGSGAGKSTLETLWASLGAVILDADVIYHELLETEKKLRWEIEDTFPDSFRDGKLDRRHLASVVFADEAALARLNGIAHKYVEREIRERVAALRESNAAVAVIEAIYLLETELLRLCDVTVAVTGSTGQRMERIRRRDRLSEEQAWARVKNQQGDEYYFERCDHVLENEGDLPEFLERAAALYRKLTRAEFGASDSTQTG